MENLEDVVIDFVKKNNIKKCLVGFSGGVDSTVLLRILSEKTDCAVRALYVNHSLSPKAKAWGFFCESVCSMLNVPFYSEVVDANPQSRQSTEDVARKKRYEKYKEYLEEDESLILGHHADDQVETVLLQLFRGAGINGLVGMSSFMEYENGYIARPFLHTYNNVSITKEMIESYAKENKIEHLYDDSNSSNEYKRNYLRNEIVPLLKAEFPNIEKTISRSVNNLQDSKAIIDSVIEEKLSYVLNSENEIITEKARTLEENVLPEVVRAWMKLKYGEKSASKAIVLEVVKSIMNPSNDTNFKLKWGSQIVKRGKGDKKGLMIVEKNEELNYVKKQSHRKKP